MKNSNKAAVRVINRAMIIPPETQIIAVTGDNNAESVQFEIPRWYDGTDMGAKEAFIDLETPDGYFDRVVPNRLIDENKITLEWIVTAAHAAKNGVIKARVRVQSDGFVWQSRTGYFTVDRTFAPDGLTIPEPQITAIDQALTQIETARRDSIAAAEEARDDGAQAVQIAQDAADAVHAQIDRADADIRAQIDELDAQTREQADAVEAEVRAQAQAAVDDLAATALRTSASKFDFVAPQGNPVQVRAARKSAMVVESSADCEVAVGGKNLFGFTDAAYSDYYSRGVEADIITDNEILLTRTSQTMTNFVQAAYIVSPALYKYAGQRFTLSASLTRQGYAGNEFVYIVQYDASNTAISETAIKSTKPKAVFTIKDNCAKIILIFRMEQNTANPVPEGATLRISNIQIEAGDTATTFAPFAGLTTATLTANTPTELTASDSDVTTILASAGRLTVRYNRESMDTLKAITCETADEGAVATIHPVQDAPVHVQARYTAKQHFDWYKVEGQSAQVKTTGKNLLDAKGATSIKVGNITLDSGRITCVLRDNYAGSYMLYDHQYPAGQYTLSMDKMKNGTREKFGFLTDVEISTTDTIDNNFNQHYSLYTHANYASGQTAIQTTSFTANEPFRIGFQLAGVLDVVGETLTISNIRLELGSTATSYEPYSGGHASPSPDWPQPITSNVPAGSYYVPSTAPAGGYWRVDIDEDLGGVRDDKGKMHQDAIEIDEYTGRWRRVQHIFERIVDGTEGWIEKSEYGDPTYSLPFPGGIIAMTGFCSHYKVFMSNTEIGVKRGIYLSYTGAAIITEPSCASLEQFKSFLAAQHAAGTPITIRYALATPTITTGQAARVTTTSGLTALPVESIGLTVPDPDHPCEITGVEVTRLGTSSKNLLRGTERFEVNDEVTNLAGTVSSAELFDGCYTLKTNRAWQGYKINFKAIAERVGIKVGDVLTYSIWAKTDGIPIKNVNYSFWASESSGANVASATLASIPISTSRTWTQLKYTFTVTEKLLQVTRFRIESDYYENPDCTTTTANVIFAAPQLEFGPAATPHEPHRGTTQTAALPAPLYGLPDAPAIYDSDGWTEDGTACVVLDGTEPWKAMGTGENLYFMFSAFAETRANRTVKSSHFPAVAINGNGTEQGIGGWSSSLYIRWAEKFSTVEALKTYLAAEKAAGTPAKVTSDLPTPTRLAAPPMHLGGVNPDCHVYGNADSVKARSIEDPKWAKAQLQQRLAAVEGVITTPDDTVAQLAARVAALEAAATTI